MNIRFVMLEPVDNDDSVVAFKSAISDVDTFPLVVVVVLDSSSIALVEFARYGRPLTEELFIDTVNVESASMPFQKENFMKYSKNRNLAKIILYLNTKKSFI